VVYNSTSVPPIMPRFPGMRFTAEQYGGIMGLQRGPGTVSMP